MAMQPKRYQAIVDTLQEIELYLKDVSKEIERSAPVNDRHADTLRIAKNTVKAITRLHHMLADTPNQ